jgi:hypothetical protein
MIRLTKETARLVALILVTFCAAAVHANAGPVSLPVTGSPTCQGAFNDTDGFNCATSVTDSMLSGTAVNGVEFSTVSAIVFPTATIGANDSLQLTDTGTITGGTLSGSLPVSYNFQVTSNGLVESWGVTIALGTAANSQLYGSESFGGSIGTTSSSDSISGSGTMTLMDTPISGTVVESVYFQVAVSTGTTMSATFPFEFQAVNGNASTAPEPASVGLLGAGLGLIAWRWKRARNQS